MRIFVFPGGHLGTAVHVMAGDAHVGHEVSGGIGARQPDARADALLLD